MNIDKRVLNFVNIALSQYGITEVKGEKDNPEILKYFDETGYSTLVLKDETAWCCAFINWCAEKAGLPHSGKLWARSWGNIGRPVNITDPENEDKPSIGDVCVFWRGKSNRDTIKGTSFPKGHVGIFIRESVVSCYCLGGNQDNSVCIKKYPKGRLVTVRRFKTDKPT